MEFRHEPVLFEQCMEGLAIRPQGVYVDGTLGGGGHSTGICRRLAGQDAPAGQVSEAGRDTAVGTLIGIDRDRDALAAAEQRLREFSCRKYFVQNNYANIREVLAELEIPGIDGALLDLGVSSFQLDNPDRGFSYMHDAPLDMRMNRDDELTAADVVNGYGKKELADIISRYGEERWAGRIADFIVKKRQDKPISTTQELVDIIKAAIPASARRTGPHPAKRTFQAIRIEVNDELGQLGRAVEEFLDVLNPGGRLCIITFHSLEDRIVKDIFNRRADPCTCPKDFPVCVCGKKADIVKVTGKPIKPGEKETEENPRARSAKLRIAEKINKSNEETDGRR